MTANVNRKTHKFRKLWIPVVKYKGCSCRNFIKRFSLVYSRFTVETQFNEVPRDWGNWFVVSSARYIEVLFHTLHHYWAEKYCSLYRGRHYVEVCSIKVPLYSEQSTVKPNISLEGGTFPNKIVRVLVIPFKG